MELSSIDQHIEEAENKPYVVQRLNQVTPDKQTPGLTRYANQPLPETYPQRTAKPASEYLSVYEHTLPEPLNDRRFSNHKLLGTQHQAAVHMSTVISDSTSKTPTWGLNVLHMLT